MVGLTSAAGIWLRTGQADGVSDFDQLWHGARALWSGENPYALIGPERPVFWPWPLYYPLTAILAVLPLAALPLGLSRSMFTGGAAASLAYAITRDGFSRLPLLLSVPFLHAVQLAQWSPLLTAMYLLPGLAWLSVAKPNVGLAVIVGAPSGRAVRVAAAGGGLLLVASFFVLPRWPGDWLDSIRSAPHITPPFTRLGGPLLLLALLRWRRPEARLLAALACVPQTPCYYEALPVLLVAGGLWEVLALVLLSDLSFLFSLLTAPASRSIGESALLYGRFINLFYYLPALVLVLRRPNEGPVPDWLDMVVRSVRGPALLRRRRSVPTPVAREP